MEEKAFLQSEKHLKKILGQVPGSAEGGNQKKKVSEGK